MKRLKTKRLPFNSLLLVFFGVFFLAISISSAVASAPTIELCNIKAPCSTSSVKLTASDCSDGTNNNCCGSGNDAVQTSINFGCYGDLCTHNTTAGNAYCTTTNNAIVDLLLAIIRFLSDGVGIVIVASVIVGGIQYIVSRGDPGGTQAAIGRLTSAVTALVIFIFAWSFLQFIVPDFLIK